MLLIRQRTVSKKNSRLDVVTNFLEKLWAVRMIRLFGISHLNYVCYAVFVVIDAPIRIFSILRGRFTLPFGLIKFEFEHVRLLSATYYAPLLLFNIGSSRSLR